MPAILFMLAALAGFFVGRLFVLPILVAVTIVCIVIVVYLAITKKEIEELITIIFAYFALVCNAAMWATFYLTTDQHWLGTFLSAHVIRQ